MTSITDTHPTYVAGTWKLDPTHSEVTFSVKHLAISKVRGSFERFTATIVTAEDPTKSTVEASIEVASVNTNQKDRDNHLRTNDFFKADEFPTITFVSTSVNRDSDDITVVGELSLRGVTKSVTLTGEFGGIVVDGYGQSKAGFSASTKINRHDFGVSWNAALEAGGFTLGDDVTINFELQFILQAA
ncbi:YceI family protein [Frigoribacterium sp. CG_9.8]|uniref:YceI family protein n=1 Tax=Frigoribacterium sp. CG_9.8 TaxID=2787733 RepID=UPI0018CBAD4C|nr:YceI family protein [Frigoribacterium sp. CG_9.8]MBG6107134.1 polyisoprenoid-binding protein YceI [Frigoribacterium sp. CG_9.8]